MNTLNILKNCKTRALLYNFFLGLYLAERQF